jgi:hypothetical protein
MTMDREKIENAMRLIREYDSDSDGKMEIDSRAVASLTALLESVASCDEMDDETFDEIFDVDDPVEAGVTALEILAKHDVVNAIPNIVDFVGLHIAEDTDYDFPLDDIADVLASYGVEGIVSLLEHAVTGEHNERARGVLIQAVNQWGTRQEEIPESVKNLISYGLDNATNNPIRVNTVLMMLVVDWELEGFEASIEKAFSSDRIDCGMAGEWEDVKRILHAEGVGLIMPERPYNSLRDFRIGIGVGVFSKKSIFLDGEIQEQAAGDYLDNAVSEFASSDEGGRIEGGYLYSFLEIGLTYLGVTIDAMTVGDVREILLDIFPRKVSMKAEECSAVISELCAFWQFVDRVYHLQLAKEIEAEIRGMQVEFRREMSNPTNFGLAKSLFMAGQGEGYDMTNQEEMHKFLAEYNSRLATFDRSGMGNQGAIARIDLPNESSVSGMSLKMRKKLLEKKKRK